MIIEIDDLINHVCLEEDAEDGVVVDNVVVEVLKKVTSPVMDLEFLYEGTSKYKI